jgi:hypothetical protein
VLLAFFLYQRSKRQNKTQPPETGGAAPMQQPYDPTAPVNFAQPPVQPGYMYSNQYPAQPPFSTDPAPYPEKLAVQGSPQMSSPSSAGYEFRTSDPPYSAAASELPSNMRTMHELGG